MDTKHNPSDKNTSRGNNECHGTNCLKKNTEIHDDFNNWDEIRD